MTDAHSFGLPSTAAAWLRSPPKDAGLAPVPRNTDSMKLHPNAHKGIQSFVRYLADIELPPVSRLILYGSYARGDFDPLSDVDVAVVLAGTAPEEGKAGACIRLGWTIGKADDGALHETLVAVNPMVLWESELSNPQEQVRPSFFHNILKDGIEITAAL